MPKTIYIGNNENLAEKVKYIYFGSNENTPIKIVKVYIGDSENKAQLVFGTRAK